MKNRGQHAYGRERTKSRLLHLGVTLFVLLAAPVSAEMYWPTIPDCERTLDHVDIDWTVFFDFHSAELSQHQAEKVHELASIFLRDQGYIIALAGHRDDAEIAPEEGDLGLRRVEAVATALKSAGVQQMQIYTKDLESSAPLVQRPPGVPEPLNRRVNLTPVMARSERQLEAIRQCKAAVRRLCFGPLSDEQQTLCEHALNDLALQ